MYLGDMYIGQGSQRSPNKILGADLGPQEFGEGLFFTPAGLRYASLMAV